MNGGFEEWFTRFCTARLVRTEVNHVKSKDAAGKRCDDNEVVATTQQPNGMVGGGGAPSGTESAAAVGESANVDATQQHLQQVIKN